MSWNKTLNKKNLLVNSDFMPPENKQANLSLFPMVTMGTSLKPDAPVQRGVGFVTLHKQFEVHRSAIEQILHYELLH